MYTEDIYHEIPSCCSEHIMAIKDKLNCLLHSELIFPNNSSLIPHAHVPSYTCTGAGVPHIVEQILQSLDGKSLVISEQVSSIWREVIADLRIWKRLIKHKIASNPLWRAIFKRRGWWVKRRVGTDMQRHI